MTAKVSFEIDAPANCSRRELIEWIAFELGWAASMPVEPLGRYEIKTKGVRNLTISIPTDERSVATEAK